MSAVPVFETFETDLTALTTYNFSAVAIGTAAADRIVVVIMQSEGGASATCDIAGSAADIRVTSNNGNVTTVIATRLVTTGTTADIDVTWNTGVLRCVIGVYSLTGAEEVPVDTDSDAAASGTASSLTVTIPAEGCAINGDTHGTGTTATTWGGSSAADYNTSPAGNSHMSGSLTPSTGSLRTDHNITTSHANSSQPIAAATVVWEQVAGPPAYDQDGFQFINDDGSESGATDIAAEDTNISRGKEVNTRLRIQIDTVTSDPPTEQAALQYKEVGDPASEWRDVPLT